MMASYQINDFSTKIKLERIDRSNKKV